MDAPVNLPAPDEGLSVPSATTYPPVPPAATPWTAKARTVIIALAGKVPEVGGALSFLISTFWPEPTTDLWQLVSANVSKMIDVKILQAEIARDSSEISGIKDTILSYLQAQNLTEKGNLLDVLIGDCTNMYNKLTQSPNNIQLVPFTIAFSFIHLAVLKERLSSGEQLFGKYDPLWLSDLQDFINDYRSFLQTQSQALLQWRSNQITYDCKISGLLIKTTTVSLTDAFNGQSFQEAYSGTDVDNYKKADALRTQAYWVSLWTADFLKTYSPTFYMNRLIPGCENDAPVPDPDFTSFTIGPFAPGLNSLCEIDAGKVANQQGGTLKDIQFWYGNNMDNLRVDYLEHAGVDAGVMGGSNTKMIMVDPGKRLVSLRFYTYNISLRSVNFLYDDGSESEMVMSNSSQTGTMLEIPLVTDYQISNLQAFRDPNSSSANFYYWFWIQQSYHPAA